MGPGSGPPPNEAPDDISLIGVLTDTGLGDILLFAAVCVGGAILVEAFSVHPFVTSGIAIAVAAGSTWVVGKRAGGGWGIRTYALVFLVAVASLAVLGVAVFLLRVMVCDC
jgi:hypothetical protein